MLLEKVDLEGICLPPKAPFLRVRVPYHLQVGVVHTVEHHWIDIFEYNMFLYQNVLILFYNYRAIVL